MASKKLFISSLVVALAAASLMLARTNRNRSVTGAREVTFSRDVAPRQKRFPQARPSFSRFTIQAFTET